MLTPRRPPVPDHLAMRQSSTVCGSQLSSNSRRSAVDAPSVFDRNVFLITIAPHPPARSDRMKCCRNRYAVSPRLDLPAQLILQPTIPSRPAEPTQRIHEPFPKRLACHPRSQYLCLHSVSRSRRPCNKLPRSLVPLRSIKSRAAPTINETLIPTSYNPDQSHAVSKTYPQSYDPGHAKNLECTPGVRHRN